MTITIQPGANAPLSRACNYHECGESAIVDCQIPALGGQWGYLCPAHLYEVGSSFVDLVTNITSTPLHFERPVPMGGLRLVSRG